MHTTYILPMQDLDFNEVVELISKEDPRYDKKAYTFIRQGRG